MSLPAGKVAERSEALVARWDTTLDSAAAVGAARAAGGAIEVDIDDAAQAVTLEVGRCQVNSMPLIIKIRYNHKTMV